MRRIYINCPTETKIVVADADDIVFPEKNLDLISMKFKKRIFMLIFWCDGLQFNRLANFKLKRTMDLHLCVKKIAHIKFRY